MHLASKHPSDLIGLRRELFGREVRIFDAENLGTLHVRGMKDTDTLWLAAASKTNATEFFESEADNEYKEFVRSGTFGTWTAFQNTDYRQVLDGGEVFATGDGEFFRIDFLVEATQKAKGDFDSDFVFPFIEQVYAVTPLGKQVSPFFKDVDLAQWSGVCWDSKNYKEAQYGELSAKRHFIDLACATEDVEKKKMYILAAASVPCTELLYTRQGLPARVLEDADTMIAHDRGAKATWLWHDLWKKLGTALGRTDELSQKFYGHIRDALRNLLSFPNFYTSSQGAGMVLISHEFTNIVRYLNTAFDGEVLARTGDIDSTRPRSEVAFLSFASFAISRLWSFATSDDIYSQLKTLPTEQAVAIFERLTSRDALKSRHERIDLVFDKQDKRVSYFRALEVMALFSPDVQCAVPEIPTSTDMQWAKMSPVLAELFFAGDWDLFSSVPYAVETAKKAQGSRVIDSDSVAIIVSAIRDATRESSTPVWQVANIIAPSIVLELKESEKEKQKEE